MEGLFSLVPDVRANKKLGDWVWVLGLDTNPNLNPKPKCFLGLTNSEFNSIHFGVKIKKKKIYECQKFLMSEIFERN